MNKKELYKTIGLIDDDLITEAENSVKLVKHLKISKIAAVAAAAVMLLSLSVWAANVLITSRAVSYTHLSEFDDRAVFKYPLSGTHLIRSHAGRVYQKRIHY